MDDAYSKTVILACAAVALVVFIVGSFMVFKGNQDELQKTNSTAFTTLNDEIEKAIPTEDEG